MGLPVLMTGPTIYRDESVLWFEERSDGIAVSPEMWAELLKLPVRKRCPHGVDTVIYCCPPCEPDEL